MVARSRRAVPDLSAGSGPRALVLLVAGLVGVGGNAADPPRPEPLDGSEKPALAAVAAEEDSGRRELSFTRVHVPPGRLAEISPPGVQHVPMPAAEFEAAVRQFTAAGQRAFQPPQPAAEMVQYRAQLDEAGRLLGEVEFVVAAADSSSASISVPVGRIDLQNCRWRPAEQPSRDAAAASPRAESAADDAGPGGVDLFGLPDGTVELRAAAAGVVTAAVVAVPIRGLQPPPQAVPLAGGQPEFSYQLPLLPALATRLQLDLPVGLQPRIAGCRGRLLDADETAAEDARQRWEFRLGPRDAVELSIGPPQDQRLLLWTAVHCDRRVTTLDAVLQPVGGWTTRDVTIAADSRLAFSQLALEPGGDQPVVSVERVPTSDGRLAVRLPLAATGRRWPLRLRAVLATTAVAGSRGRFPGLAVEPAQWAGGGLRITAGEELRWTAVSHRDCLPVAAEVAARWPLPSRTDPDGSGEDAGADRPLLTFELQRPEAAVAVSVAPRQPDLDIARVTTVDVTTSAVIGRAACDIRVRRGRIHRLEAVVGDGWFIDSVEPLAPPPAESGGAVESPPERPVVDPNSREAAAGGRPRYEWRVIRERRGDRLILDLPAAVTVDRDLRLRITGHRGGIPAGGRFSTAAVEMVRVSGEVAGQCWIDLRTSSDTTLQEIGGGEDDEPPPLPARLVPLAEGDGWRQRIAAGSLTPARAFRLLRRRPPLEVEARSRFTVRGDRLSETYSFICRPLQGQLDALTVHFSEPVGQLDWSLLAAGETTVFARRLEPVDRGSRDGPAMTPWPAAESWRIELTPPVPVAGTLRATAGRPFTAAVPLPLAWVESAVAATGEVLVQAVDREQPEIRNRRLTELPPRRRGGDLPLETVSELAYDMRNVGRGDEPAAELVPPGATDRPAGRAWAWNEQTTVRCYASAAVEFETRFDLENDGRRSLSLSLPTGHRLLGVNVGGERLPLPAGPAGQLPIYLPAGRRRLAVTVRTAAVAAPWFGLWRLSAAAPTIDVPTLTREWRLLLPLDLRVAAVAGGFEEIGTEGEDWASRLVGGLARVVPPPAAAGVPGVDRTFRERRFVPAGSRFDQRQFLLVDRWLLTTAAGLVAALAAGLAMVISWRRSWLLLAAAAGLAVASLWGPQPLDLVLRAGLWAGIAVAILRLRPLAGPVAVWLVLCGGLLTPAAGRAAEPYRVLLTPVDGGTTALVPQPLFRVLAATDMAAGRPGTRLLDCRVELQAGPRSAPGTPPEIWWLKLLVDSDAAISLKLDQTATESRFATQATRLDGGVARANVSADRRRLTLPLPSAGRHTIAVPIEPAWIRRGDLEVANVRLPVSPRTRLVPAARDGDRGDTAWAVEWSRDGRVFLPAAAASRGEGGRSYRLPAASEVRLVRPVAPESSLVSTLQEVTSRNRLKWTATGCNLLAEFTIDTGRAILPAVWLQADPRLVATRPAAGDQPTDAAADYELTPVEAGVYRIDRRAPVPGVVRFEIPFSLPLESPVGVFDLPEVWLRGPRLDHREVQLSAAADLDPTVRFPGLAAPPLLEDSGGSISWSADLIAPGPEAAAAGPRSRTAAAEATMAVLPAGVPRQPVVLEVERRPVSFRGRQQLEIVAGKRETRLQYEAVIDAGSTVWAEDSLEIPNGFDVETCQLSEWPEEEDTVGSGPLVDAVLREEAPGRLRLVPQRPRSGRLVLRLTARRGRPLPAVGSLPLVRSSVAAALPYSVIWRDQAGRGRPALIEDAAPAGPAAGAAPQTRQGSAQPAVAGVEGVAEAGEAWRIDLPVNNARWRFRTAGPAASGVIGGSRPAEPAAKAGRRADRERPDAARASVALADIEVVVDERGRLAGIGRFDLVTAATTVGLRLPAGYRLFELLVDGRPVRPTVPEPAASEIWRVPLRPGRWPREIGVVFVGEIGEESLRGRPLTLDLPMLTGLPVERVLWTIDHPASTPLRVSGPARRLAAAEAFEVREAAAAVVDRLFAELSAENPEAGPRLGRLRGDRPPGRSPLADWKAVGETVSGGGKRLPRVASEIVGSPAPHARWSRLILAPGGNPPAATVRFVDPAAADPGRIAATLLVLLATAAGWWSVTRRPGRTLTAAARWWPAVAGVGSIAWLVAREPLWPGILVLGVAAVTLIDRRLRARPPRPAEQSSPADAETLEFRAGQLAAASSVTRTAVSRSPGGPA